MIHSFRKASDCDESRRCLFVHYPKNDQRKKGQNRPAAGVERCYQTCYHFLEKAARNRMNQGPSGWVMSLK